MEHELHVVSSHKNYGISCATTFGTTIFVGPQICIVFASFDIWMFRGGIDTFTLVINYLNKI